MAECKVFLFLVFPKVISEMKQVLCAKVLILQHKVEVEFSPTGEYDPGAQPRLVKKFYFRFS